MKGVTSASSAFKKKALYHNAAGLFGSTLAENGSIINVLLANLLIELYGDTVKKSRIRYSLTQKGIDLLPLMLEMIIWGGEKDSLTESPKEFMEQATNNKQALLEQIREGLIRDHLEQN